MPFGHMIDLNDYSRDEWMEIVELAGRIRQYPHDYIHRCEGRIMATLFYEPSTRTQMSFQAAMQRLGGQVIGFDNPGNSSVSKGETLRDTIRIVSGYSDVVVMRHPVEGTAKAASIYSGCPVINAGDGGHLHPTQTLTDMVTLFNLKGTLCGLKIGLCGDLKNGRTVHSLIKAMSRFEDNSFYLISTPELAVPDYIRDTLRRSGCRFYENNSLEETIHDLDVLYMTRIQRERFLSPEDYERQRGIYILDKKKLQQARADLTILHPLPRVDEIEDSIDGDSRAAYFKQAVFGMYARMALILRVIDDRQPLKPAAPDWVLKPEICRNTRCIVHSEKYLPHYYKPDGNGSHACIYCDKSL